MTWHATGKYTEPDNMQHPVDGRAWKDFNSKSLIDDLKDLWAKTGVETINVATSQEFNMRSMVLWTINNFLLEVVCLGGVGKRSVRFGLWTITYSNLSKPLRSQRCEDDPDVIHVDNSFDLTLSTSLNDLEIATLHIDGQSIDVDAPRDIIDVVDEDDDIIDEKVPIPHDLADFDNEDLINLDIDDGVNVVYSSEEED
nr:hypothetical protein [Tanacetum cinerariifolium]